MTKTALPPGAEGPAWAIARLFPAQGHWDEGDFLALSRNSNHLIEFDEGTVEVLELPTRSHQRIVLYLYNSVNRFVNARGLGEVIVAPYPVRLWSGKIREPDLVFALVEHVDRLGEDFAGSRSRHGSCE